MPAGVLTGEGIVEPVHQHRIEDLRITHAVTPAPGVHEIGRSIHVLHTAGNCAVDESEHDFLRSASDGLRTRAANPVDRHRGDLDGDATIYCRLSGWIHLVAGLDHVAHDDGTGLTGLKFCTIQCRSNDRSAKVGRRHLLVGAAVGTDRGAHG